MINEIKYTDVYIKNLEAFNKGDDLIINQGGQGSSKTVSILQVLADIWNIIPSLRITVSAYALPHLKAGAINDFHMILRAKGLNSFDYYHISENTFRNPNKSYIEFVGIEGNEAKATGPRRDILYVNEANKKISYQVFELMNARTHLCAWVDFNPSAPFWFHEQIQPNFKHTLIKSTYLDNPYLPERELRNLLSKRDNPLFANWWKVYGLGELGTLEGAIFQNVRYENDNEVSEAFRILPTGYAMDFGFHPDPDVLIKVAINEKEKKIFAHEIIYQAGLGVQELSNLVANEITDRNKSIIADSSNPRMIFDLGKRFNIKPVDKPGVIESIRMLQEYEIILSSTSYNAYEESQNYIWSDKKAGIPVDKYNHFFDALRYYQTTHTLLKPSHQIWRG